MSLLYNLRKCTYISLSYSSQLRIIASGQRRLHLTSSQQKSVVSRGKWVEEPSESRSMVSPLPPTSCSAARDRTAGPDQGDTTYIQRVSPVRIPRYALVIARHWNIDFSPFHHSIMFPNEQNIKLHCIHIISSILPRSFFVSACYFLAQTCCKLPMGILRGVLTDTELQLGSSWNCSEIV
jgi:hypothetical protein